MRASILVMAAAMIVLVAGCDDDSTPVTVAKLETLVSVASPAEDANAERVALTLSKKLLAPQWLYDRVHRDLATIRETWGDSSLHVDVEHSAMPGQFLTVADRQVLDLSDSISRRAFDSLRAIYDLAMPYIDTVNNVVELQSARRYYPYELVKPFTTVAGIKSVENGGRIGDWPDLYVLRQGNDIKYFFMGAWGDCPAGCGNRQWTYIVSQNGTCRHVGTTPVLPPFDNWQEPVWWDTMNAAMCDKLEYVRWDDASGWTFHSHFCGDFSH